MTTKVKAASIKDIADACGVSRWTVSAVLFPTAKNQHVGFSEETRDHVLAVAAKLRYRPHRGSRNLLVKRQGVIGILTGQFFMIPWASIHGMLVAAQAGDQVLSFEYLRPDDPELPLFIREKVVDGLILFERVADSIAQAIAFHHIPAVFVNACLHATPNAINMDEAGAIATAVRHLVAGGRRRLAMIVISADAPFAQERIAALRAACRDARMDAPLLLTLSDHRPDRERSQTMLEEFLRTHPACDAVITPHGGVAGWVSKACHRVGRRIPADLAVICMQDPDLLLDCEPPVTAFALPEAELGARAVGLLQQLIAGQPASGEILLPYAFHIRGSSDGSTTGPPS